ncbi:hypothetical protein [Mammaliicoccus vitulinus]|uniref:hypothetical protein n=1 Tax=Mammaliicoccus vitulinus TaxID=71237 RepID=UPI00145BFA04|nr:hypothetical protein [Mammaliicoccus vitulinus]MEB7658467.1 hypothetical protein [Mammaliicoccus vitulinus]QJF23970.1 hypothetical protein HF021_01470 [Mammaliicoccus vitulinus]
MKKPLLKVSLSLAVLAGTGTYIIPQAQASSAETQVQPTSQQIELANTINTYLTKDGQHLKIKNPSILSENLKSTSSNVTLNDVKVYVNNFNAVIDGEKGEQAKQDLLNYTEQVNEAQKGDNDSSLYAKKGISCSNAITTVGFVHTAAYGAAALALGVSGPAGWAVGTAMAGTYAAGSMAC